jgi:hypothetical protein
MSGFYDELKELRTFLAENGVEVTLERLLEVLEDALNEREAGQKPERFCPLCQTSNLGLCADCLKDMLQEDL